MHAFNIKIPETIKELGPEETSSFVHVMTETPGLFLSDVRWGKDLVSLRHSFELVTKLKKLSPGDYFSLTPEKYEVLKECIERPSVSLNPMFARKLFPYFNAVLDAVTSQPTPPLSK